MRKFHLVCRESQNVRWSETTAQHHKTPSCCSALHQVCSLYHASPLDPIPEHGKSQTHTVKVYYNGSFCFEPNLTDFFNHPCLLYFVQPPAEPEGDFSGSRIIFYCDAEHASKAKSHQKISSGCISVGRVCCGDYVWITFVS